MNSEQSPSRGHNLKDTTDMLDLESKRSSSPDLSEISARTDRSKGQTENFNGEPGISIRSRSPCLSQDSERTDRSKGQIENFNGEPNISISDPDPQTEDPLTCSICKTVFADPVCIPCGDSFCKKCITSHWQQPNQEGVYDCPQCLKAYDTPPELYTNRVAVQMLKRANYSPVLPKRSHARDGDVACDFCIGTKLRAVKWCLSCTPAYCETHIKQHYTDPVLLKHQLKDATGELCRCPKHLKTLDVVCNTDLSLIPSAESVDSEEEPFTLSSKPEPVFTHHSNALQSPLAGSKFPGMMTPPTGTPGTSQCGSLDSDPKRPVKRGHDESPPHPSKHMRISRKLQFNKPDEEEAEAERFSHGSILNEKLMKMRCDTRPDVMPANI
ncbi:E3 ubiquitin-protein ligase RNF135-like isoform X1 [Alosa sapidissima]|uniref:E3 ubiquitin-protein ligase RNF135-like isoform X1 n=1 Tax=Alosa sapidissima TaxID=34773 RepID=UPI001C0A5A10|nr:E3 ubiquitin-protein ligase RNF135-like isoform X1 [Alosa sapidissima]XP_041957956.1 E3 ubiquitin-protein ligase RNF135-like isoform X1 [Alosa sapidissima]